MISQPLKGVMVPKSGINMENRHRDNDKPDIIRSNGDQEWWINGKCIKKLVFELN